MHHVVYTYKP
uniref:Uncharacterized protein n=1 Tax=Oryza barthii TaxID=65489 RepID=A0A0G2KBM6_9ORYZ